MQKHGVDQVSPIIRRGVLLDIAGQEGVSAGEGVYDYAGDAQLPSAAVKVQAGDVVLIRTAGELLDRRRPVSAAGGTGAGVEQEVAERAEGVRRLTRFALSACLSKHAGARPPAGENGIHSRSTEYGGTGRDRVYEFPFAVPMRYAADAPRAGRWRFAQGVTMRLMVAAALAALCACTQAGEDETTKPNAEF
jgi:hypothetical protein